ncbi:MAG TPA: type VI secretion protein ImpB [Mesorhizobium sp.]|uniref:Y-family DNA polymerase n=1 Tax=Mesorhizobium sp. TaxID=1871066 RepID=UPI002DDD23FA|nr:type VI secretion protein ImpB [Mesorhizobium sp.]HEV2504376.1 type VI secretion protein ImpB [Mesorhizobium sp.]
MRKPETIERLYLDFDGFFASVEQQCDKELRGRPVGVVPFEGTDRTCVIACSKEAKAFGVKNVMNVNEARQLCPDIVLVPQKPDLYRRAHNTLLAEIESVIPIDTVKSIDELTCRLDDGGRRDPVPLVDRLKRTLANNVGTHITSSVGIAANRQLAKIACKVGKKAGERYGNGLLIWNPEDLPEPLFKLTLEDIPGIGENMARRLYRSRIQTVEQLYNLAPKHMRKLWHNVTGERLWYALHGYDVQAPAAERGMFGHGRVLPPESRSLHGAYEICRLLLIKAARRLRRGGYYCAGIWLWLSIRDGSWQGKHRLPIVHDDQAVLAGLDRLWARVRSELPRTMTVFRVGVTLMDLSPADQRQLDFLEDDDRARQKWERAAGAIDRLNAKYGRTVMSLGMWKPPAGGHVGGKISYTRIPTAEDFW